MLVSTTVVSTRILRPSTTCCSRAIAMRRPCSASIDLRAHGEAPAAHRLGVGDFAAADAREVAIHQVRPDFAFQGRIAPIAQVLQHEQPQHHLGRAPPAARACGSSDAACPRPHTRPTATRRRPGSHPRAASTVRASRRRPPRRSHPRSGAATGAPQSWPRSPTRRPRARGRPALPLATQLLAIQFRDRAPDRPERGPGLVRRAGVGRVLGRHIQRPAVAVLAIREVQVGPMPIRRIVMTLAGGLATAPGGFRQPALDHGAARSEQRAGQGFPLTHRQLGKVVQAGSAVKWNVRRATTIF